MELAGKLQQTDYLELAKSITDVFFAMDKDLRFIFWNKASEMLTGIPAADALGKSLYEVFPQSRGQNSEEAYLEVLEMGQPKTFLNQFEINGDIFHFEISAYPLGKGLSIFAKDISGRIAAEQALRGIEARFRRVFDESPVGAAIVSLQYSFLSVNNSFSRFIGYSREELLTMRFSDITFPHEIDADLEQVDRILAGETEQFEREKRYICKNGNIRWAHLSVRLVRDAKGRPQYLIPIIQDIDDLKSAMTQLILAKENAEEMNRRKSRFLTNMSHELRTPLNGILGFSELLMEEKNPDRVQKMAEVINKSGDRLLETLNLILDLSKLETGATVPRLEPIDLVVLAKDSLELFRAAALKKNLELKLIKTKRVLLINSDRKIISDILNNLINNAVKFTPAGRISIKVDLVSDEGVEWVMIEVADTGIGIAEENLIVIFEEFRQLAQPMDTGIKGSGLGLSLCKKYSELLGGTIHVSSKLTIGSVFTVWLPIFKT